MDSPLNNREIASRKRREQVLDAAAACFVERGFHQTGMREIAKRASVSLGNLYNHFPSKHDMLIGLAELELSSVDPFVEMLMRNVRPSVCLREFTRAYFQHCSDHDAAILYLDIAAEAMREPDIAERFLQARSTLAEALTSLLFKGVESKDFGPSIVDTSTADLILDLIEGAAARGSIDASKPDMLMASIEAMVFAALRH
ncbi:TetR/AcrR family transcriptional regulator [Thalassococcus lentus]|uniref:TetR/AcrR family transcriptional regulator n=1 Tax=Thalassococcus lentus TaxID=1210524 RepID=A0ABT4XQ90_9RHOB|nr:TetR/AcrR family transcriptional regulator [Thalassococcus lentus]MDA7424067.1 TetR/AcrR family transcriptional regulator [Thalassococcus lentus]